MDFPIAEFMDEDACPEELLDVLHPDGLAWPRRQDRDALKVHRRPGAPALAYRCALRGRVLDVFTGPTFHRTRRRPSELMLILRGIAPGETTARLARELNRHRPHLLKLRHRLRGRALEAADPPPLDDRAVEAAEMHQDAGETRPPARRPGRSAPAPGEPGAGARRQGQRPAPGRGGSGASRACRGCGSWPEPTGRRPGGSSHG